MKTLPFSTLRRLLANPAVPLSALVSLSPAAFGSDIYWDSDGATAGGSSDTIATGNWGTSAFWSTDATGAAATTATWTSTDTAVFSAGSDVTGASTVTINADTVAAGLKVEDGSVTFVSATTTKSLTVNSSVTLDKTVTFGGITAATNVNLLLGTNSLTLNSGANVTLYGTANTMGDVNINGGSLFARGSSNTGALGTTGTVYLGATGGSTPASLRIGDSATVDRPVSLGGTTGTLTINNLGFGTDTKFTGGVTGTNKLSIQSVISGASLGKLTVSTGKLDFTGALTLETIGAGTNASAVGTLIVNSEITDKVGTITIRDTTTGTRGAQKVVLGSTANAYTGDTIVTSGILQLGASDVIANGAGKGNVSIAAAGTLDLAGFSETINGLSGSGTITRSGASGTSTLTVGGNNASSTFSGTLQNGSGTLALTKTGSGTLTLDTSNSYSGVTSLANNGGILAISHGSALGTSAVALTKSGADGTALELSGGISVANNFTFASANFFGSGGSAHIRNVSGNNTLTGNLTLTAVGGNGINLESAAGKLTLSGNITSTLATRHLSLGGAGDGEVTGTIVNTGVIAFGLTKSGGGTWTLSGPNSYTGTTAVSGGTLVINGNQSTATGAVTVSNTGTRLMGSGTVGGNTTISSGAIHAPGTSPGVQKFTGNLTYADASIFEWEINRTQTQTRGTGYDGVNVTGTLAGLDGADAGSTTDAKFRIVIGDSDFSNAFWNSDHTWADIFTTADGSTAKSNWASIFGGGFEYFYNNGTTLTSISAPTAGSFTFNGGTSLKWTAVPEPSSALVGLLLGAGLLRRRRP